MTVNELRIWKTRVPNSPHWVIRYIDPLSGKRRQRSTNTTSDKAAERLLGELRAELLKGTYRRPSDIPWAAFRLRYEVEVLPGLAAKTQLKIGTVLDALEAILQPTRLRDLTPERISLFQAKLREGGRAETTIAGYLAHLRAALQWGVDIELLPILPKIQKPKRSKTSRLMKGRPISQEEFDLMLAHVEDVVGLEDAPSWRHYLEGLWWSGLRLTESLELYWDNDAKLCIDSSGDDLMLRIPAEMEKGHKDRLLPVAPEFAEFLLKTPVGERTGRIFTPHAKKVRGDRLTADRVQRIVGKIGKAAGILVDSRRTKFASAHDLRRSFGERWAARVMPQVLMELMRHESIDTTLRYYVGRDAQRTARVLKDAYLRAQEDQQSRKESEKR